MNVDVIGAAGWGGRAVLENFAGRHRVRAFDYNPDAGQHCNAARAREILGPVYKGRFPGD